MGGGRDQHEFLLTTSTRSVATVPFVSTASTNQEALPADVQARLAEFVGEAFHVVGRVALVAWAVTLPAPEHGTISYIQAIPFLDINSRL